MERRQIRFGIVHIKIVALAGQSVIASPQYRPNFTHQVCPIAKKKPAVTQGTAHFREQAEAWLAEVLGEEAAALMVERSRG